MRSVPYIGRELAKYAFMVQRLYGLSNYDLIAVVASAYMQVVAELDGDSDLDLDLDLDQVPSKEVGNV